MWALHFEVGTKTGQIAPQCQQRFGKDQVGCHMGLISNVRCMSANPDSFDPNARNAEFLGFNKRCSCSAKRVQ